jgi:hypothetical protein
VDTPFTTSLGAGAIQASERAGARKEWTRIPVSDRRLIEESPDGSRRILAVAHLPTAAWVTRVVAELTEFAFAEMEQYGGIASRVARPRGPGSIAR